MKLKGVTICIALALAPSALAADTTEAALPEIEVIGNKVRPLPVASDSTVETTEISRLRPSTSDSARLLDGQPGVSLYGAGGVSSLPVIHGLADDRLNIKVDGVEIISSCPNHMNSALSYIDPTNVGTVNVWAGIAPVSAGGDSIGGAIAVESAAPVFAAPGEGSLKKGEMGASYRSNGSARSSNLSATLATESLNITLTGATTQSGNYKAGGNFKTFTATSSSTDTARAGHTLPMDEVGSTAYKARNYSLNLAYRNDSNLVEAKFGYQDIPYELYPNQRMDMLGNTEHRINLRYLGQLDWGSLEARAYQQQVDHYMDFGPDKRFNYGSLTPQNNNTTGATYSVDGMPMYTKGKTSGATIKADVQLNSRDLLRTGAEVQNYRLDDWWPPAPNCGEGNCVGGMAPLTFWNINGGKRDRLGIFAEWEARLDQQWLSLLGIRTERVASDTGTVVGYNTSTTPLITSTMMSPNMYESSSIGTRAAFNAMDRRRTDNNVDLTALARYTPETTKIYEFGFARKTRSPNLYERYDWADNGMAAEMNNFVGDGNGYLGNPFLKPETAHTLSFSGNWKDADNATELKISPYFTRVNNFIDAVRVTSGNTSSVRMFINGMTANGMPPPVPIASLTNAFINLKYANQSARLYGVDISGKMPLSKTGFGDLGLKGLINYASGKNLDTSDNLYNIMPLNAKLTMTHTMEGWDNGIEVVGVKAKTKVSAVRNEQKTPGYGLVNLRGSYSLKQVRFDFGVENMFNKLYYLPLGGAYTAQGATMSLDREVGTIGTNGGTATLWGIPVPGPGRSLYAGMNLKF